MQMLVITKLEGVSGGSGTDILETGVVFSMTESKSNLSGVLLFNKYIYIYENGLGNTHLILCSTFL
jgi:hypothetical protein